jgi:hypothetical protein
MTEQRDPAGGPMGRLDAALVPRLRHLLRALERQLFRPVRWERSPSRPRLVRAVATHPLAVAALAGVVVFSASAVHLARSMVSPIPEEEEAAVFGAPAEVGPLVGADLTRYRDGRHDLLATLDGDEDVRAVVSFTTYLPVDALPLPDGMPVEAVLLLVDDEPWNVEVGVDPARAVDAALAEARSLLDDEIAEVEGLLEEDLLDDPAFEEDYAVRLDELRATRSLLTAGAPLVFGAVVVAPPDALRALVGQPEVRVVDPGGPASLTQDTVFHGVLPDDRARASVGRAL